MSRIESNSWIDLINSPQKRAKVSVSENKKIKPKLAQKPLKEHNKQNDPLSSYPLRGLAYTNEVGVAIMSLSKVLGTVLWIPALMYFGADIYNKYAQGREGDYSQVSKRKGFERAAFQSLASVALPTLAVLGGQKAFSHGIKKWGQDKIAGGAQVEMLELIGGKIEEGALKGASKESAFVQAGKPILKLIELKKNKQKHANKWKISNVHFKETLKMESSKVEEFIRKNIDEVLELKTKLKDSNFKGDDKFSKKLVNHFKKLEKKYEAETNGKTKAIRETMQKYLNKKAAKPKTIKTIGGFIALICLALPIDYLVEEVILKKAIKPSLDFVEEKLEENPNLFFLGKKN